MNTPLLKTLMFLLFLLPLVVAYSNSHILVDLHEMEYKSDGRKLEEIEITNTGSSAVSFVKSIVFWNNNAKLKELKLENVKIWSNDSNPQPSGTLLPLNGTLAAGDDEEIELKFDNDVTNKVSRMLFELDDGSTIFVKLLEGYVSGTLDYQVNDGETVIATDYAKNATLYLIPSGFSMADLSLIKPLQYQGNITIDADGSGDRCTQQIYATSQYFYDENSDDKNEIAEQLIYEIYTDQQGCYAFNIPEGNYDIYS